MKPNDLNRITIRFFPVFLLSLFLLYLSSCSIGKTVNKGLDGIDKSKIRAITEQAGKGLIAGINLDSIKTQGLITRLLQDLDTAVNQEINGIELHLLKKRITLTLDSILVSTVDDPVKYDKLKNRITSLVSSLVQAIQKDINGLNLDLVNDKLLNELDELRAALLGPETSDQLSLVLTNALDSVAGSAALVKIISKVNTVVEDVNKKADKQMDSLRRTIKILIYGLIGLGLLVLFIIGYAYRKRVQSNKYKELAALLTKGLDQIKSQKDYDRIVEWINLNADTQQVRKPLLDILAQHQGQYPGKVKSATYAERTIELINTALNGNEDMRNKILSAAKTEPGFLNYLQQKLAQQKTATNI